jgi:hypothetical protein
MANDTAYAYFQLGRGGASRQFIPGDADGSGVTNNIDVTYSLSYLKGGPAPALYVKDKTEAKGTA